MGRVGTHTRPGIIPKSTACAPLVHWNHYSSERGRGESPPAEARSTRLFPDQSKSTSLALQIIQDFYLAFHSKLFLCPSILFILQFICIYIYVKLEKFTKKKEKYMRIFRSCQSYDNEVIMIQKCSEILSLEMTLQNFKKIVKGNDRGKESGSNVERSRHFTLDFATILFSPNRSWYGQRERERDSAENRRHCSGQQCWNSCARQEVKTASRRLSRRRRGNDIARGPSETRMLASRTLRKAKPPVRLSVCACARLSI